MLRNDFNELNKNEADREPLPLAVLAVCVYIIAATVFENAAVINSGYASYALYLCLFCCGVSIFISGFFEWYGMHTCLLIFGVILSISALYSPTDTNYMYSILYRYWTTFVLLALILNVIKTNRDVQAILYTFIVSGAVLSLVIYSHYGIDYLLHIGQRLGNEDFGNINSVGVSCALSVALGLYVIFTDREHKVLLYVSVISVIICIPIVMFSGSRKALLSILIVANAFILSYYKNENIKSFLLITAAAAVLFIMLFFVPAFEPIRDRILESLNIFSDDKDLIVGDANRIYFIEEGLKSFLQSPVIGNGFCYSTYLFGVYSHSNYIELLMNNGIIGLASFYSAYIILFNKLKLIKHDRKLHSLAIMIIVMNLFLEIGIVDYYDRISLITIVWINKMLMINEQADDTCMHEPNQQLD